MQLLALSVTGLLEDKHRIDIHSNFGWWRKSDRPTQSNSEKLLRFPFLRHNCSVVVIQTSHPRLRPLCSWTRPLHRVSHSVSADGIVFRHNFHCATSRRGWKSWLKWTPNHFVLSDPRELASESLSQVFSPALPPPLFFWEVKPGFPRFHSP